MSTEKLMKVKVLGIYEESPVVKRFRLAPEQGSRLIPFSGGAHIKTVVIKDGVTYRRPYSLISSPDCKEYYEIAIRKSDTSKGGSITWHNDIQVGDVIEVGYPSNYFPLNDRSKHHVFFAAGIGITPFLSMMKDLTMRRQSFELHYAAKSKELCAFYSYLNKEYKNYTHFYFFNKNERMTPDIMKWNKVGTSVYFCGPSSMVHYFSKQATLYGYPKQSIHYELFNPPESRQPKEFFVKLNRTGKVLQVPKDKTLLQVLVENHIKAPYSCQVGACGSCQIDVIEGEVDHRDVVLSQEEKEKSDCLLTCVSRANSPYLVIDL